jgi:hypothetical protein
MDKLEQAREQLYALRSEALLIGYRIERLAEQLRELEADAAAHDQVIDRVHADELVTR